ncbi:MAG: hypothetical protein PHO04_02740 [Candidatus Pacebacteria bacterium]|jgi:hypothetical protein|nr:hypothetical protein [Candidatus Paceibacterota bacterium]NMB47569.1 hypothetical protein [Patescibacteria group bacterium]MDD2796880.1 hypothetical protein [Candidatus Paceibacterota bacterium]MDD3048172.1 hypothetical protein [Candidatus Paceibacterota bacterium]MDD3510209.1 hypothetical protein [Candidatus Paceibacterota bacterium]
MAIEFNEKRKINVDLSKIIMGATILVLLVIVVMFIKNGASFNLKKEQAVIVEKPETITIDFEFLSAENFKNLEGLKGIPMLPGFFEASDTKIEIEKIEYGRTNPFMQISEREIESAIVRAIQKIKTEQELEEVRIIIQRSSRYTSLQKSLFLQKINEQAMFLQGEESEEHEQEEEIIKETINYYKEW